MDIFVDHEKMQSNKDVLLDGRFHKLPRQEESTDKEIVQITMKTDLNQNNCQWKHMAKNLTECVRLSAKKGEVDVKMADLSFDEIAELAIYDANHSS